MQRDANWNREHVLDWRRARQVLRREKWIIIGCALVAALLALAFVRALTPLYSATVTLLISVHEPGGASIDEPYRGDSLREKYHETQLEILKSRPIVAAVIAQLGLAELPEFSAPQPSSWRKRLGGLLQPNAAVTSDARAAAVPRYIERLVIEPVAATQLVRIHFKSQHPELAARIANAHAQAYIESMLEARLAVTAETAAWMQKRLTEMQHELQQSEADLAALREGAVPSSGGGMHGNDGTGEGIAARLAAVRRVLAAHVGTYEQIDAAAARDASLQGIREIQNDPGVSSAQEAFAAAQQQVAEIGKRYGPQHPTMIAAMSERDRAKTHLDESRRTIAEQIRAEYESALAEERALVAAATRGADRRTGLSQEPTELDALEHAVEINRELYDLFYKRVSETAVASEPVTAHARVIEPALAPIVPSRPRAGITIAGTFLGALLLGAVVAFVGDSLNNTLRSPQDVGAKLGQSLLAMVPPISVRKLGRVRGGIIEDAAYAEAMHTLRLSILTGTSRRPQKVVLVTSALAGEGKSTIALNLAAELAKTGKVLIIDGDMRRPAIGRLLDLPRYDAGLSELITRTAPFKACLAKTKVANLHVIRTGFIPDDPQELLAHRRLAKILRVLTQAYTHIVIDSPPVLSVPDAAVLSKYADAVVLVTLAHSTPVPQIESGLHQLERVDAPVAGVVLNGLDRRKAARYAAAYRDREERRA